MNARRPVPDALTERDNGGIMYLEQPLPRALRLAHQIVDLVRQADVSEIEQNEGLYAAAAILRCYVDRAPLPQELENREPYHEPSIRPAS